MIPGSITLEVPTLAKRSCRGAFAGIGGGPQVSSADVWSTSPRGRAGNRIFVTMVTVGGRATRDNAT
jgi:hypothetical protein